MSQTGCFLSFSERARQMFCAPGPASLEPSAFNRLACELFALQYQANLPYRRFCQARGLVRPDLDDWTRIPAVPAAAFKEWAMTCFPPGEAVRVFHSSGTTGQAPSRHFHSLDSLATYEASLLPGFATHVFGDGAPSADFSLLALCPPPDECRHSSLAHMFATVSRRMAWGETTWLGRVDAGGGWELRREEALSAIRRGVGAGRPVGLLGTAFLFVHLLEEMERQGMDVRLPAGSRVMETGGYKGRSRELTPAHLRGWIGRKLGIPGSHIITEYGMSELGSQAYDAAVPRAGGDGCPPRRFQFPPWVGVRILSPETGTPVREGETGLIRVYDLANVYSVMAIQTEDLGVLWGRGFELAGRARAAEPRGCSLLSDALA